MFTMQSSFIILLIDVFSIFHNFLSTLVFRLMINRHIGIVRSLKLYSIFLLTISVFSISTGPMTVFGPDIFPIEKFILYIRRFFTEWWNKVQRCERGSHALIIHTMLGCATLHYNNLCMLVKMVESDPRSTT